MSIKMLSISRKDISSTCASRPLHMASWSKARMSKNAF
jgi:hypothetical protein